MNNIRKAELKGSVNLCGFDFTPIDANDILDIHRYLIKEK